MDLNPDISHTLRRVACKCWKPKCSGVSVGCRSLKRLDVVGHQHFWSFAPQRRDKGGRLLEVTGVQARWALHCNGSNIKYVAGEYWDFFDHYVPR